jgi:hypothetical protein
MNQTGLNLGLKRITGERRKLVLRYPDVFENEKI